MDEFWKAALKVGGPVAIIAFLIYWFSGQLFEHKVLEWFGSDQRFIIVMVIVGGLLICLFSAIIVSQKKPAPELRAGNKAVFHKSTIKGDVVLGDKRINTRDENGE